MYEDLPDYMAKEHFDILYQLDERKTKPLTQCSQLKCQYETYVRMVSLIFRSGMLEGKLFTDFTIRTNTLQQKMFSENSLQIGRTDTISNCNGR